MSVKIQVSFSLFSLASVLTSGESILTYSPVYRIKHQKMYLSLIFV